MSLDLQPTAAKELPCTVFFKMTMLKDLTFSILALLLGSQDIRFLVPVLLLNNCVTLGKLRSLDLYVVFGK